MTHPDPTRRRRSLRLVAGLSVLTVGVAVYAVVAGPIHLASRPGSVARTQDTAHPATSPDSSPPATPDGNDPTAAATATTSQSSSTAPWPTDSTAPVASPVASTAAPSPTATAAPTPPPVPPPTMVKTATFCVCWAIRAPDGDVWTYPGAPISPPVTYTVIEPTGVTGSATIPAVPGATDAQITSTAFDGGGDMWVSVRWTTTGAAIGGGDVPVYDHTVIERLSPQGQVTQFTVPGASPMAGSLVLGPDGAMWFSESQNIPDPSDGYRTYTFSSGIGRVTSDGVFTSYPTTIYTSWLAVASDETIWFLSANTSQYGQPTSDTSQVGRITMDGTVSYLTIPLATTFGIAGGQDGDVWINGVAAGSAGSEVLRETAQGVAATYHLPAAPSAMIGTPDGNLWFLDGDAIGVLQPEDGKVEEFTTDSPCPTCISGQGTLPSFSWAGGYLWVVEGFGGTNGTYLWRLQVTPS